MRRLVRSLIARVRRPSPADAECLGTSRHLVAALGGLVSTFGYRTVLEIGTYRGYTTRAVARLLAQQREPWRVVTVDPTLWEPLGPPLEQHVKSSDEYFRTETRRFDVVLIDGDHAYAQVQRDFENALRCLRPNGTVVLHDYLSCSGVGQFVADLDRCFFDVLNYNFQVGISFVRPAALVGPATFLVFGKEEFLDQRLAYLREHGFVDASDLVADCLLGVVLPASIPRERVRDAVARAEADFRAQARSAGGARRWEDELARAIERLTACSAPGEATYEVAAMLFVHDHVRRRSGPDAERDRAVRRALADLAARLLPAPGAGGAPSA